jgi:hypothetical protein
MSLLYQSPDDKWAWGVGAKKIVRDSQSVRKSTPQSCFVHWESYEDDHETEPPDLWHASSASYFTVWAILAA